MGCGDAPVFPGDIVVVDGACVIIIPADIAEEIADEAIDMTAYEDFVVERVKEGAGITGLYPGPQLENLEKFAAWRRSNNR